MPARVQEASFQVNATITVVLAHVGQNHVVAGLQSFEDLHGVVANRPESYLHPLGVAAIGFHFKEGPLAVRFGKGGTSDKQDVVQGLDSDDAVNRLGGELRHGRLHVHRDRERSVDCIRVDARHFAGDGNASV